MLLISFQSSIPSKNFLKPLIIECWYLIFEDRALCFMLMPSSFQNCAILQRTMRDSTIFVSQDTAPLVPLCKNQMQVFRMSDIPRDVGHPRNLIFPKKAQHHFAAAKMVLGKGETYGNSYFLGTPRHSSRPYFERSAGADSSLKDRVGYALLCFSNCGQVFTRFRKKQQGDRPQNIGHPIIL